MAVVNFFLLLETGDRLLLETGTTDKLLLEEDGTAAFSINNCALAIYRDKRVVTELRQKAIYTKARDKRSIRELRDRRAVVTRRDKRTLGGEI